MFEDEIHLKLDDIEHFAPFHIVWDDKGTAKTISNKFIRFMGIMDIQEIQENLWVLEPFSGPIQPSTVRRHNQTDSPHWFAR